MPPKAKSTGKKLNLLHGGPNTRLAGASEDEKRATKSQKISFNTELIAVLIGPTAHRFDVHKGVLTKTSPYFKACCNGLWSEAQSKTVELPDADPATFDTYLQWLYTGSVVVIDDPAQKLSGKDCVRLICEKQTKLIDLYILADQIEEQGLRNEVITQLLDVDSNYKPCIFLQDAVRVSKNTTTNSTLFKLFVDIHVTDSMTAVELTFQYLPEEFKKSMMMRMLESRDKCATKPRPSLQTKCEYHEHNEVYPACGI